MTETNDHILAHSADGVMTIRMNRPDKKNAITGDMYARMAAALDEANADDAVNTVLILGSPGAFSSGNDIADFMQVAMSGKRESMSVFDFLERIIMAPKPVVAGVDGLAIGIAVLGAGLRVFHVAVFLGVIQHHACCEAFRQRAAYPGPDLGASQVAEVARGETLELV